MIERKDLKFFSCCAGLGQDVLHLAHKENTYNEILLLGRLKFLVAICSLTALI